MTFRRHQAVLRALERLYAWTNVTTSRNLHNYFPHLHGGDPNLRVLRADLKAEAHPSPDETTVVDVAVVHSTSDGRTRISTAEGHLHGRVRMAAADAAACGKRDRLDRHMAAAAPVGAPAGTRFLPLVFEVHGGCTDGTCSTPDPSRTAMMKPAARSTDTRGGTTSPACSLTPSRRRCAGSPSLWLPLAKPALRARTR